MNNRTTDFPLVIVGAGAAGIGASRQATALGLKHVVLEASHRLGGRGLTETLDGAPVDLGCHWMHCAGRNPFVGMAREYGFRFATFNPPLRPFEQGCWQPERWRLQREDRIASLYDAAHNAVSSKGAAGNPSLWSVAGDAPEHLTWLAYWMSLMHSVDMDETAVSDIADFVDTGEDWPVVDGYGALIEAVGQDIPVRLNTPVRGIRRDARGVRVETDRGKLTAARVLVTVSTGILGAGDIRFTPALPDWKAQAIHDLPLGNANYAIYHLPDDLLPDAPPGIGYARDDVAATLQVRPGGQPLLVAATGGRFGWWLEKQGEAATQDWLDEILVDVFGSAITRGLGRFKASAWGFDPWIRGGYSAARPGSRDARRTLAEPVDDCLWFAGEAASPDQFSTAHGAWLSGQSAVSRLASG